MPADSFRPFAVATPPKETEETTRFLPRFDDAGLLPAIISDTNSGDVPAGGKRRVVGYGSALIVKTTARSLN